MADGPGDKSASDKRKEETAEDLRMLEGPNSALDAVRQEQDTELIFPDQIVAALADGRIGATEALAAARQSAEESRRKSRPPVPGQQKDRPSTETDPTAKRWGAAKPAPASSDQFSLPAWTDTPPTIALPQGINAPTAAAQTPGSLESPPTTHPAARRTNADEPASDEFNLGLDAEIARLLERTRHWVKDKDKQVLGPPTPMPKPKKKGAFELPPGAPTPGGRRGAAKLVFDEAAGVVEEPTDRLGLLDSMDRDWEDEPTPIGDPRRRRKPGSVPPRPAFLAPSMTAPLKMPEPPKRKPSNPPLAPGGEPLAPVAWTDPPSAEKRAQERSTTRRMRETARRVGQALAPLVAKADPWGPWLTLGTIAIATAWVVTGVAAHSVLVALVGVALVIALGVGAVARVRV